MKRILTYALTLLMLLALTVPAFADVIWEPNDNSFYDNHRGSCEYENRCYYANGENGFVTLVNAPGSNTVRTQYENGTVLWAGYTYKDSWALISRWENDEEFSGWVLMADLTLKYDYLCFEEEYGDKITDYNGEFADYNGNPEVINFYEYPGAPEVDISFEVSNRGMTLLENLTGTSENPSYIHKIFVDEDGRTWGFINYMYGYRNAWFCLDEPDGENFPVREVSVAELTPAQEPSLPADLTPAQEPSLPAVSYVPYFLVAAVVVVTAGLLVFFYGKRKKSTD